MTGLANHYLYKIKIKENHSDKKLNDFLNVKYILQKESQAPELTPQNKYKTLKEVAKSINQVLSFYVDLEKTNVSYAKACDIQLHENYVIFFKNLNFLEKLIFEHHLRNFQKKNSSKKEE